MSWTWDRTWEAYFEGGSSEEFDKSDFDTTSPDHLVTATPPNALSGKALRVEVHNKDLASGGCRAEVVRSEPRETAGTIAKYRWSTMLDADYPLTPITTDHDPSPEAQMRKGKPPFQLIAQWHADEDLDLHGSESPPLAIIIYDGSFRLDINVVSADRSTLINLNVDGENPNGVPIAPIIRSKWHHFEMTVRWGLDHGWVSVLHWQDGGDARSVAVTTPTLYPTKASVAKGQGEEPGTAYFKVGLYRGWRGPGGAFQTQDDGGTGQILGTTDGGGRIGYVLFHDEISRYQLDTS